jgi:hypothetical protein
MSSAMPLVKGLSAACSMKATVRGLLHSTAWMQMCSGRCRNSFAADSGDPSTSTCPHTTGAEGEAEVETAPPPKAPVRQSLSSCVQTNTNLMLTLSLDTPRV